MESKEELKGAKDRKNVQSNATGNSEPSLPPEPRSPGEGSLNDPPHHPGAATTPGAGPNPTPSETGR